MQIELAFGHTGLTVELPAAARPTLIRKPQIPLPADPGAAVASALDSPIGSADLEALAATARSACILICEGIGSDEFRCAQQRLVQLGPKAFLDSLTRKSLAEVDEWQSEIQLKPMRVGRIQLYAPRLAGSDLAVTGVEAIDDVPAAVEAALARHADPELAIIPEGPYIIPFARAAA